MISTSSVRRLKDRGGGGVRVTATNTAEVTKPSRSITPLSEKIITRSADSVKKPIGKENASRPTSRIRAAAVVSQKPAIKTMARVDKSTSSCAGESTETRDRRSSSSSVPRGRSSSPSEFIRSRSSRVSIGEIDRFRVSIGEIQGKKGAFRDSDVCKSGIRSNSKVGSGKSIETGKEMEVKNEKNLFSRRSRVMDVVKLGSVSSRSCLIPESNLDTCAKGFDGVRAVEKLKLKSEFVEKRGDAVHLGLRESLGKSMNRSSSLEGNKEKGVKEESAGGKTANKYPSKLHEKLAFLEGKVKRIATDIKRTKEMLDMNNPDASKVILSDIQETVAGIEKAMGHVVNNDDQQSGLEELNENDNLQVNGIEKCSSKLADDTKSSAKGLNTEELEARFFPHHKLLRERTSLKASSGKHQIHGPKIEQPTSELKVEENLTSVDENLIALEILASLSKEKSKVTARGYKEDANLEIYEVQEIEDAVDSAKYDSSDVLNWKDVDEINLTSNETLEDFDVQGNVQDMKIEEETEDCCTYELNDIGNKICTGGWFVSEGESVLLAHGDGSCSFYDIANCEEKAEYKPPEGLSPNLWQDCWMLRAPGADGCSGKYVVAASAGESHESGFCSWDFYTKEVQAFSTTDKDGKVNSRKALAPLPNNPSYTRNSPSRILAPESSLRWYKPCGPLIVSTATCQKVVKVYDIRDGELIMVWQVQKPVLGMEYSSPLQWRNRGKMVLAETEGISVWDVDSQHPEALMSISSGGRKISALHINNTDAELGGGVRQRVSSSEAEGNDGVFCTADSINILDFRNPSGIGLKIPKLGTSAQSVFSRGDSIYLGSTNLWSTTKKQSCSLIQQFSIRKQKLFSTYTLPKSNALSQYTAITQVYGNSNLVMGVCGVGQFAFDAFKDDDSMQLVNADYGKSQKVKEVIGPDDLYSPSFDYLGSRLLLISRDRPAQWRYLS